MGNGNPHCPPEKGLEGAAGRALWLPSVGSAAGIALGIPASNAQATIVYQAALQGPMVLVIEE